MASEGYPLSYPKGRQIDIGEVPDGVLVLHAGTTISKENNTLVTAGGRVIAVCAYADTLKEALNAAYRGVDAVQFQGKTYRKDIGHRYVYE